MISPILSFGHIFPLLDLLLPGLISWLRRSGFSSGGWVYFGCTGSPCFEEEHETRKTKHPQIKMWVITDHVRVHFRVLPHCLTPSDSSREGRLSALSYIRRYRSCSCVILQCESLNAFSLGSKRRRSPFKEKSLRSQRQTSGGHLEKKSTSGCWLDQCKRGKRVGRRSSVPSIPSFSNTSSQTPLMLHL